jgi:hypothetical protein
VPNPRLSVSFEAPVSPRNVQPGELFQLVRVLWRVGWKDFGCFFVVPVFIHRSTNLVNIYLECLAAYRLVLAKRMTGCKHRAFTTEFNERVSSGAALTAPQTTPLQRKKEQLLRWEARKG